jgi:ABC-2 type transport system ATP-binding protein
MVPERVWGSVNASRPIIRTQGLVQAYGPKVVLRGIDLEVGPGASGLLGPNGAGKSSFLRAILGLIPLREGRAEVLGFDSQEAPLEIRRRIGLVPESDCLVPGMNAVEMTSYCGQLVGMARSDALERAHQVLYYVGLREARYRDLGSYSQGMKQRLKLAQALVHDPDLLLLDEPTNGMDPPGREAMLELIRDISRNKGLHVILSTHLLPDVEETCDQVIVLHDGRVAETRPVAKSVLEAGRIFDVAGLGDFAALRAALEAAGHGVEERDDGLRVSLQGASGLETILKIVEELGERVEVRHLVEAGRSLQDSFLEAVR